VTNYHAELARAIEATHGLHAIHLETKPVKDGFRGDVAWQGDVEVFGVADHPIAKQCFAWGVRRADGKGWDVTAVLAVPPVTTPELAVKAAIAAHAKQIAAQRSGSS
jgi:hypothetical protein